MNTGAGEAADQNNLGLLPKRPQTDRQTYLFLMEPIREFVLGITRDWSTVLSQKPLEFRSHCFPQGGCLAGCVLRASSVIAVLRRGRPELGVTPPADLPKNDRKELSSGCARGQRVWSPTYVFQIASSLGDALDEFSRCILFEPVWATIKTQRHFGQRPRIGTCGRQL